MSKSIKILKKTSLSDKIKTQNGVHLPTVGKLLPNQRKEGKLCVNASKRFASSVAKFGTKEHALVNGMKSNSSSTQHLC